MKVTFGTLSALKVTFMAFLYSHSSAPLCHGLCLWLATLCMRSQAATVVTTQGEFCRGVTAWRSVAGVMGPAGQPQSNPMRS
jgi:hypothetical protein